LKFFKAIVVLLILLKTNEIRANYDSLQSKTRARKKIVFTSATLLGTSSLIYLNQAWYSDYKTGSFHFFNDNEEWLQMDKIGHSFATYQSGRLMMEAFDWAGYSRKQKLYIGGALGFYYLTVVECMDGFSEGWGFSWGDMFANFIGTSLAISQEALWAEQRIQLKFFYRASGLAKYNPNLLGNSWLTSLLKDYNGQSYWLSINPSSFMNTSSFFPGWLTISIGYGASGMIGASQNPPVVNEKGEPLYFDRYRRWYLSLDLDLKRIPVKSPFLKTLFSALNVIKFPCPTLEYSQGRFWAHAFYP